MLSSIIFPTLSSLAASGLASPLESPRGLIKRENIDYEYRQGDSKPNHCILHALGENQDDSDNLVAAVEMCGTDGVIELQDPI